MPRSNKATRNERTDESQDWAVEWEEEEAEDEEAEEDGPMWGLAIGEGDEVDEVDADGAQAEFEPELEEIIMDKLRVKDGEGIGGLVDRVVVKEGVEGADAVAKEVELAKGDAPEVEALDIAGARGVGD